MNTRQILALMVTTVTLALFCTPDLDAGGRGRGSFGGSRSYRSYSSPRYKSSPSPSYNGGSSFGGSRSRSYGTSSGTSMFRGGRMSSAQDYTRSYGVPRRQESTPFRGSDGVSRNYVFNQYGGYADGLMTGYAMGRMSWWWYTPFHPAFYYSAPPYVVRTDGTMEYYPPTFSFGTLFFTLLVAGAIVFILFVYLRNRRRNSGSYADLSQSSFG